MGALIQNGLYQDIYRGTALKNVSTQQFDVPWLFRAQFSLNSSAPVLFTFKGISYRGVVYVNGEKVVSNDLEGTFVYHDVVVKNVVAGMNAVTVSVTRDNDQVFPPDNESTDL